MSTSISDASATMTTRFHVMGKDPVTGNWCSGAWLLLPYVGVFATEELARQFLNDELLHKIDAVLQTDDGDQPRSAFEWCIVRHDSIRTVLP